MTPPPLVVSVHDVAAGTFEAAQVWARELDELGVPATLLVVPGPWRGASLSDSPALVGWLHERARAGDEVAQHGWVHTAGASGAAWRRPLGTALARGCEELGYLNEANARDRLQRGRNVMAEAGFDVEGLTPPGWLASSAAVRAMRAVGYRYTTSHVAVTDLLSGRRHSMAALSQRPGGRGEVAAAALVPTAARWLVERGFGVRIALHPDDLDGLGLRQASMRAIRDALAAGARPMTYLDFVERAHAGLRC